MAGDFLTHQWYLLSLPLTLSISRDVKHEELTKVWKTNHSAMRLIVYTVMSHAMLLEGWSANYTMSRSRSMLTPSTSNLSFVKPIITIILTWDSRRKSYPHLPTLLLSTADRKCYSRSSHYSAVFYSSLRHALIWTYLFKQVCDCVETVNNLGEVNVWQSNTFGRYHYTYNIAMLRLARIPVAPN